MNLMLLSHESQLIPVLLLERIKTTLPIHVFIYSTFYTCIHSKDSMCKNLIKCEQTADCKNIANVKCKKLMNAKKLHMKIPICRLLQKVNKRQFLVLFNFMLKKLEGVG